MTYIDGNTVDDFEICAIFFYCFCLALLHLLSVCTQHIVTLCVTLWNTMNFSITNDSLHKFECRTFYLWPFTCLSCAISYFHTVALSQISRSVPYSAATSMYFRTIQHKTIPFCRWRHPSLSWTNIQLNLFHNI